MDAQSLPAQEKTSEVNQRPEIIAEPQVIHLENKGDIADTRPPQPPQNMGDITPISLRKVIGIFLFSNPTSGDCKAASLLRLEAESLSFSFRDPSKLHGPLIEADVYIYNLFEEPSRLKGFRTLKDEVRRDRYNIRVIVLGGDGSVMWVVEEMIRHQIDFNLCPIGVVPCGTELKRMIIEWTEATVRDFDIWDVQVEMREGGSITKMAENDKGRRMKTVISRIEGETHAPLLVYERKMSNYVSIGVDARMGLGFDRRRTHSAFLNKAVYAWEGFKKTFFKKTKPVNYYLDSVDAAIERPSVPFEKNKSKFELDIAEQNQETLAMFRTSAAQNGLPGEHLLHGAPGCVIGLNINSYAGGGSDPWGTSRGKVAIRGSDGRARPDQWEDGNFGDGKLEFVCFDGPMSMVLERFIKGRARRLGQGGGPFYFKFKNLDTNAGPIRTYLNIDGEYFQMIAPKLIKVSKTKDIPGGRIKILQRRLQHDK